MNTLKIIKYQVLDTQKALMVYYSIIIGIVILLTITTLNFSKNASENISFGGLDFASIIFMFVAGLGSFKQNFRFMQANSITRKNFLIGYIISIFPVAAIMSALDITLNRISNIFIINNSLFAQTYLRPDSFEKTYPNIIENFIWSFAALSLFAIIGYCIALIYYRSNKIMKIVISILPFILINILGYLNGKTDGMISYVISNFFSLIWGFKNNYNPFIAVLSMGIGFMIIAFISFLLIRKAPVKE